MTRCSSRPPSADWLGVECGDPIPQVSGVGPPIESRKSSVTVLTLGVFLLGLAGLALFLVGAAIASWRVAACGLVLVLAACGAVLWVQTTDLVTT